MDKYGHLPYAEAAAADLVKACDGPRNKLDKEAAAALAEMRAAAAAEGVTLWAQSCFRSIAAQGEIFESGRKKRNQTEEERAKVSAPPGYSEHATGFALDFATGSGGDLTEAFAENAAGQWLLANAIKFGFELSFPKGNAQGVSYEPWHWRFVGSERALAVFYWARQLYPADPKVE